LLKTTALLSAELALKATAPKRSRSLRKPSLSDAVTAFSKLYRGAPLALAGALDDSLARQLRRARSGEEIQGTKVDRLQIRHRDGCPEGAPNPHEPLCSRF
jgi:hypothetical protein